MNLLTNPTYEPNRYGALKKKTLLDCGGVNALVAEGLLCEGARTPPPPPVWWLYASWGGSMVLAGTVAVCFPGLLGRAR